MPLRWFIMLTLLWSNPVWTAEIYTFGKRGDGSRYIKNIDRPQRKPEEPTASQSGKTPPPPRPANSPRQSPQGIPPPIPDAQKLDMLNRPI